MRSAPTQILPRAYSLSGPDWLEVYARQFFGRGDLRTRREAAVIATKVHSVMRDEPNGRGLSRKAILFEIDQSLRRLQTDYVDLYQIHRWDYETPIEETLEALHDVVKSGKARYIGALPCTHGNSPKPSISPTFMAGPVSSPCRIIGTCSIGKRSGR